MAVKPSFVRSLVADPGGLHQLINERHGHSVAAKLLPAFDSASRKTGLLKHESLPDDTAMIIAPCSSIHTFFMRFAIDVAFVARDGRVLKTVHVLRPWRIAAGLRAYAVVELSAGTLARTDTKVGDTLIVN